MDRGTYISASNGMAQFQKLDVVNNNLANINTPGFKKEIVEAQTQSFDQTLASVTATNDPFAKGDHQRASGVTNIRSSTDFSIGPVKTTGNPLDVALKDPKDFFVINTPQGEQYTRAGDFTMNVEGTLVTQDGFEVQGDGGGISTNLPGVRIGADGTVAAGNQQLGRLQVAHFEDPSQLLRVGANRFSIKPGGAAPQTVDAKVVPSALEMSNVSAITSVIDLISAQRAFQTYTKTAETMDTLNQTAINQIGRRGN